jgi:hypothetical protein
VISQAQPLEGRFAAVVALAKRGEPIAEAIANGSGCAKSVIQAEQFFVAVAGFFAGVSRAVGDDPSRQEVARGAVLSLAGFMSDDPDTRSPDAEDYRRVLEERISMYTTILRDFSGTGVSVSRQVGHQFAACCQSLDMRSVSHGAFLFDAGAVLATAETF